MKYFHPLKITGKFPVFSLPLHLDTYRYCQYKCVYCFSRNKGWGDVSKHKQKPNIKWLRNKFEKVYDDKDPNPQNFIEMLLKNRMTLHGGVLCDCFQPIEAKQHQTKDVIDLCNEYNQTILFQTKTASLYDVPVDPKLHSFQISISNVDNLKALEPNVATIEERQKFYFHLKDMGFKVDVRLAPFIPNISSFEVLDLFPDADHYSINTLFFPPQNKVDKKELIEKCNVNISDFKWASNMKLNIYKKQEIFSKFGELCEERGYKWNGSASMNQGTDNCSFGDEVVPNYSNFSSSNLRKKYGINWTLSQVMGEIEEYKNCNCSSLFTSNRRVKGCKTVEDFYKQRFERARSPFSPKYQQTEKAKEKLKQKKLDYYANK